MATEKSLELIKPNYHVVFRRFNKHSEVLKLRACLNVLPGGFDGLPLLIPLVRTKRLIKKRNADLIAYEIF